MLLRTSSPSSSSGSSTLKPPSPPCSSWMMRMTQFKESDSEHDPFLRLSRTRTKSVPTTSLAWSDSSREKKTSTMVMLPIVLSGTKKMNRLSVGLDRRALLKLDLRSNEQVLASPGLASSGEFDCGSEYNLGIDETRAYYQKMIEANPGNALLLGNYAKFLKEIYGDVYKAKEYCQRAILANPSNGDVLQLYADIIWETQKDADQAETYFDRAVQAAPEDSYIMASYARFLWDADEEEDKSSLSLERRIAE